jgi:hypothetical protein
MLPPVEYRQIRRSPTRTINAVVYVPVLAGASPVALAGATTSGFSSIQGALGINSKIKHARRNDTIKSPRDFVSQFSTCKFDGRE